MRDPHSSVRTLVDGGNQVTKNFHVEERFLQGALVILVFLQTSQVRSFKESVKDQEPERGSCGNKPTLEPKGPR